MCTTRTCIDCRLEKWKNSETDYLYSPEEWDEWEKEHETELKLLKNKYAFIKEV